MPFLWWIAPVGAVAALVFARRFYLEVVAASPGDERMQEIAGYVREGAFAYLRRPLIGQALGITDLP